MLRRLRLAVQHERRPEGHRFHYLNSLKLGMLVIFKGGHPHAHRVVRGDLLVEPEGRGHLGMLLVVVGHGFASLRLRPCGCVLPVLLQPCATLLRAICCNSRCNSRTMLLVRSLSW